MTVSFMSPVFTVIRRDAGIGARHGIRARPGPAGRHGAGAQGDLLPCIRERIFSCYARCRDRQIVGLAGGADVSQALDEGGTAAGGGDIEGRQQGSVLEPLEVEERAARLNRAGRPDRDGRGLPRRDCVGRIRKLPFI